MSEFEKWEEKRKKRRKEKEEARRRKREQEKKMANMSEEEIKKLENYRKELGILVDDVPDDEDDMDFKGNLNDERFKNTLKENREFARDPTHKDYNRGSGG
jgi:hypothetical protein